MLFYTILKLLCRDLTPQQMILSMYCPQRLSSDELEWNRYFFWSMQLPCNKSWELSCYIRSCARLWWLINAVRTMGTLSISSTAFSAKANVYYSDFYAGSFWNIQWEHRTRAHQGTSRVLLTPMPLEALITLNALVLFHNQVLSKAGERAAFWARQMPDLCCCANWCCVSGIFFSKTAKWQHCRI